MEPMDVDRALKRPGEYFFEDGLWEITVGLWMALTVALPLLVGGAAGNWSPVMVLLTSLGLRPAVLAAKGRWVYPRTGRVTYPDPEEVPPTEISLGLSPASARSWSRCRGAGPGGVPSHSSWGREPACRAAWGLGMPVAT